MDGEPNVILTNKGREVAYLMKVHGYSFHDALDSINNIIEELEQIK